MSSDCIEVSNIVLVFLFHLTSRFLVVCEWETMDTSQNKDIAMRQNLLSVGGKNAIPPQHIIKQQRRLSQTQLSSDHHSRKIIHSKHKELCPLCHRPSFIFKQISKYDHKNHDNKHISSQCGTFMCSKCSNKEIQSKLSQINKLKQENKKLISIIKPMLNKKVNAPNTKYYDKKLKMQQYQHHIANLRLLIKQKQTENKQCMFNISYHILFSYISRLLSMEN